ncbi:hypothetical protein [Roseovarius mucosus]|uniref:hypothetical protein n=1 Tax=Roseovarius mucosus TaxID=215743 RepID=UPI0035D07972
MTDFSSITLPTRQIDLTRRNFLAAMTAPLMVAHVTDAFPAFAHNIRPPHSPTVLPFVKDATKEEQAAGAPPRSFWQVKPTGDYGSDCATGALYAELALDYMVAANAPQVLQWTVFDMMTLNRRHSGIEVSFMSAFGRIATQGRARTTLGEGAVA